MARNRFATRAAILRSAERIIAEQGICKLGVNALAKAAGCDKVLVYRYFGGLDGVLTALGAKRMLWPAVATVEPGSSEEKLAESLRDFLLEEWTTLRDDPLMLAAAAAECTSADALAEQCRVQRAESHEKRVEALRALHRFPPYVDVPALLEFLSAALTLLALRSAHPPPGSPAAYDPATPAGRRRLDKTVGAITKALLGGE